MIRFFKTQRDNNFFESIIVPVFFSFSIALLLLSCSTGPAGKNQSNNIEFSRSYTHETVPLEQKLSNTEITIAEKLLVVLETSVPENMEIEFPEYSASLGDFTLTNVRISPARMTGAGKNVRVVRSITYYLEPYLPGNYTVPEMIVTYRVANNESKSFQIGTDKIIIPVKSLLDQDKETIDIKDIRGPVSLPANTSLLILLISGFLFLLLLGIAGFLYWQKKSGNKKQLEVDLRPEQIAILELEKLLAEDLLARGKIKLFHHKISDILRHYIENRFGIKAPERTTEEFLTELSATGPQKDSILGIHKELLNDFLVQCDLVKFAKHEPTPAESEKSISICRQFIEDTAEKIEDLRK